MIRKAVIPAAGRGTRLLPATKNIPKELLPIAGKPMIHLCIEEAVAAGIEEVCIILNPRKTLVKDYFSDWSTPSDREPKALRDIRQLLRRCRLKFAWQPRPRGLADAIDRARDFVGTEPFALMLPDNLVFSSLPVITQLEETLNRYGEDTIAVVRVPPPRVPLFSLSGKIDYERLDARAVRIKRFYPKRRGYYEPVGKGPLVRTVARALLLPHFFDYVDTVRKRIKGELDDGPVLREIIRTRGLVGRIIRGTVFDVGNPRGYTAANAWRGNRVRWE